MWKDTPSSQGNQSNRVSDLRNQVNTPWAGAEVLSTGSPRLGLWRWCLEVPLWEAEAPRRCALEADPRGQLLLESGWHGGAMLVRGAGWKHSGRSLLGSWGQTGNQGRGFLTL